MQVGSMYICYVSGKATFCKFCYCHVEYQQEMQLFPDQKHTRVCLVSKQKAFLLGLSSRIGSVKSTILTLVRQLIVGILYRSGAPQCSVCCEWICGEFSRHNNSVQSVNMNYAAFRIICTQTWFMALISQPAALKLRKTSAGTNILNMLANLDEAIYISAALYSM